MNFGEFSWDTSASNVNLGSGVNEWSTSKLKDLLNNGAYYNRTTGTCYRSQNNTTTACDFSGTGLTNEAKSMIDQVTWNTGSNDGTKLGSNNINTNDAYNLERSNHTGKICTSSEYCNDSTERTTSWTGQVGLMYPSDYGYATSGGVSTKRSDLLV